MSSMARMMEVVSNMVSNNTKNKSYNSSKKGNSISTTNRKKSGYSENRRIPDNFDQEMKNYENMIVQNEIQSVRKNLIKPDEGYPVSRIPTSISNKLNISKKINFSDSNIDNNIYSHEIVQKNEKFEKNDYKINSKFNSVKPSRSEIMDLILTKIQVILSSCFM
jgi:hypothetical protein